MFDPKPIDINIRTNLKTLFIEEVIGNCPNLSPGKSRKSCLLILDESTSQILDKFMGMVDLIEAGVIGIERLALKRKPFPQFHAMYFLQPTDENIQKIKNDFLEEQSYRAEDGTEPRPLYDFVHLMFTGPVSEAQIQSLTSNSKLVLAIVSVRFLNLNIYVMNENLYSLNFEAEDKVLTKELNERNGMIFEDLANKSLSVFTLIKKVMNVQLVYKTGGVSESFAEMLKPKVQTMVDQVSATKIMKDEFPPVFFVIVDRGSDLVSPLLRDISYCGQFFGVLGEEQPFIESKTTGANGELVSQKEPLDEQDPIWLNFKYKPFGEMAKQVKEGYTDFYKKAQKSYSDDSKKRRLEDEVRNLPQFQETIKDFAKHIETIGNITKKRIEIKFEEVFKIEQALATGQKKGGEPFGIKDFKRSDVLLPEDQLRLALIAKMAQNGDSETICNLFFDPEDSQTRMKFKQISRILDRAKSEDNSKLSFDEEADQNSSQYYKPKVIELLSDISKGKIGPSKQEKGYATIEINPKGSGNNPFQKNCFKPVGGMPLKDQAPIVAFFFIGGISYSECAALSTVCETKNLGEFKLLMGGTRVYSPQMFLNRFLGSGKD